MTISKSLIIAIGLMEVVASSTSSHYIEEKNPLPELDKTPNPTYGDMGRRVTPTGWDSTEMQARQAKILINYQNTPIST